MAELRWVLLALGVLLVVGVYLWGRRTHRLSEPPRSGRRRWRSEPRISSDDELISDEVLFRRPGELDEPVAIPAEPIDEDPVGTIAPEVASESQTEAPAPAQAVRGPERIVALRFVPREAFLDAVAAVAALREAGLEHGRYGIFHLHDDAHPDEPQFSVASLTEPGS